MNRFIFLLLLLGVCTSLVAAASAPTFCKCTCFSNSTIIEIKSTTPGSLTGSHLVEPPSSLLPPSPTDESTSPSTENPTNLHRRGPPKRAAAASPSCSQCNRAFCLAQTLPICKGAGEKDVVTMCFQRDSRKDQIIVWGFILGTAGLLGWAAVRKVLEVRESSGGFAGTLLGGSGGHLPVGRVSAGAAGGARRAPGTGARVAASGSDGGRGQYANVAVHSRENSVL